MSTKTDITRWVFEDDDGLTRAMQGAVRAAVRRHKLLGNPIAASDENGNVVIIQPEDIVLEGDES